MITGLVMACSSDDSDDTTDDQVGMEDDGMMDDGTMDDTMTDDDNSSDGDMQDDGSEDDDTDGTGTEELDIIGLWVLSDMRLEDGVDDLTLELLDGAVDDLVEEECYLLTFNFKDDGTVDIESRIEDFEVEGLEVTCPEQLELTTVEWELDGDQLILNDEIEGAETITITPEDENTFIVEGEDLIDEEFEGSQGVFTRSLS